MKFLTTLGVATALTISSATMAGTIACGCPSDIDGDGIVGFSDLLVVLSDWGCMNCDSDLDGDGETGFNDLLLVISDWDCGMTETPITGVVTNSITGLPIVGAMVDIGPCPVVTDDGGAYSIALPPGLYDVTFAASNYTAEEVQTVLFPGTPATLNADLDPIESVIVTVVLSGDQSMNGEVFADAEVEIFDGSTIIEYAWTQTGTTPAAIAGEDTDMVVLGLADRQTYREGLMHVLSEPPISEDQLPENVPLPPGEFPGGLQDRFEVAGTSPFALEEAALLSLDVEVTTTSGVYGDDADVHTALPWKPAAGIRTVPVGAAVLLNGKDQPAYSWSLTPPDGSSAALMDGDTQYPEFTPDLPGMYRVAVNGVEAGGTVEIFIFAGNWRGVITGEDANGRPTPEAICLNCHIEGGPGKDQFTPWMETGHAEIFTQNFNSSSYWGERCFSCHTVGYESGPDDTGIDKASDYAAFLDSGLIGNPSPTNWSTMLASFPESAKNANVQCENCHGPQDAAPGVFTSSHAQVLPRVSLSSDVCTTCHGEPLRHARFQQWQLSGHANYEVAIDESDSGNCSRCHTANGFLAWLPVLLGDEAGDPLDDVTVDWTPDQAHPQTCVACHDPHSIGTTSGIDSNATVRISGSTPPLIAGFTAYGVGRGAICMTCHNSRRGLRNDEVWSDYLGTSESVRAPHGSAQTDMLMGQNAYLVTTGERGNHSFVTDSCVNCHMVQTPPPDDLAYNSGGTNHTFFAAPSICAECHGPGFTTESIQAGVQDALDLLGSTVEDEWLDVIASQTSIGNIVALSSTVEITDVADIAELVFGSSRGRQAITVEANGQVGTYRLPDVDVLDSGGVEIGPLYDVASEDLLKAGWNWNLVNNDGSVGVHNPTYSYDVLISAVEALDPDGLLMLELPEWLTEFDVGRRGLSKSSQR